MRSVTNVFFRVRSHFPKLNHRNDMPIAREGQFLVSRDLAHTPSLGLESATLDACLAEVRLRGFKAVFGSPVFGFLEESLDALEKLQGLEAIWFWDVNLRDIDAIYEHSSLQRFGIHDKRPPVDFSRLPLLKQVVWKHKASDVGIRSLSALERLHVWSYAPRSKSFADLELPSSLTALQVNWANPKTLDGMASVPGLRRLEIARCRNLEKLDAIPALFPNLEHLVITACGRIEAGEGERVVAQLPHIRHAFVKDKVLT